MNITAEIMAMLMLAITVFVVFYVATYAINRARSRA